MQIVIASNNLHKIRELREMLKKIQGLDILSLLNYPDYLPLPENGKTLKDNVALKAEHAAKTLNKWVLADDSGLFVPGLGGSPGIMSRRYAGDDATDTENRAKLLKEMHGMEGLKRAAYFECCLALANPEGLKKCVKGTCEGLIIEQERGRNGFGYDPIFQKNDYDKTFAEIDETTKNRISHRRKALDRLLPTIETITS